MREHLGGPVVGITGVGTGLGLSIASGIVGEHDDWIDVASEVGRGARFSIYLPLETL